MSIRRSHDQILDHGHLDETVEHRRVEPSVDAYATYGWLIAFGLIAALALAGFIGWVIGNDDEVVVEDTGVTLAAVAADPETFLGEVVTVRGEVRDVVSPVLFIAGSADAEAALLVHSTELPADVVAGTVVEITGEVDVVDDTFIADFGPFEDAGSSIEPGTVVLTEATVVFDVEA